MRNLLILIANNFNILVGTMLGQRGRTDKNRSIVVISLLILAFFVISFFIGWQAFMLFGSLEGYEKLVFFNGFMLVLIIVLFLSVMKISGLSYTNNNDADLLLSLPIKRTTIVASKAFTKYLFDLAFVFPLLFPYFVAYQIQVGISPMILIAGTISVLIIPLLSVGLTYVLDFLISRLFNKSRFASLFKTFIILIFLIGIIIFSFLSGMLIENMDPNDIDGFVRSVPVIGWFTDFVSDGSIISLIWIILLIFPVTVLGIWLYAKTFGKNLAGYRNTNTKLNFSNQQSVFTSLLSKEIKRYLGSPMWVINTIIGPLFLIIVTIVIVIAGTEVLLPFVGGIDIFNPIYLTLFFAASATLTSISASSISLEGKNLWILKSMPISENKIFLAKAALNFLFFAPVSLVCGLFLAISLNFSFPETLMLLIVPILINAIMSFAGVLINLYLPKLNWQSEMSVVKNSSSVLVTIFSGIILIILGAPILFFMPEDTSIWLTIFLLVLLYSIILAAVLGMLMTKAKKLFRAL
ncbi:MAG: hypothetical protein FWE36_01685 [Erysipelotrichales bacterium]|nr:hypothetical protein [Erysipelotrichales bacterium]